MFKIAFRIVTLLILGFLGLIGFMVSDWNDDESVIKEGSISYKEMQSEMDLELPIEPFEILRYSALGGMQQSKLYLKLSFRKKLRTQHLTSIFSTLALGRNLSFAETSYVLEEVPATYGVSWWLPKTDPNMTYYQSEMGRSGPLLWVDQSGTTLFIFEGD